MKNNKHEGLTADEMREYAEAKTTENQDEAASEWMDEWRTTIGRTAAKDDGAWLFPAAVNYLETRRKDIEKGVYQTFHFRIWDEIRKILSVRFNYTYERCYWDEQGFDPETSFVCDEEVAEHPLGEKKSDVIAAFRAFLVAGAVQAKKIGSDAYAYWRRALIDFDFTYHRFYDGMSNEDEMVRFYRTIETAARRTAIDSEIYAQMNPPTQPTAKGKHTIK